MPAPAIRDRDGPADEFKAEMLALIPSLRAFARGLCRNRDLADDLAQEAMARAWAARDNYTPGTNFRAWMFMILRNQFYTTMRKNSRIAAWDPEAAERLLVTPATQHVRIDLQDLERAMAKLPTEQREMLLLVVANGLSYEEAAEITGCALGTVKSRIARARTSLTQMMEPNDDPIGASSTSTNSSL
jgi:RNA polymerase sigma-70 factor, ECF subfamily